MVDGISGDSLASPRCEFSVAVTVAAITLGALARREQRCEISENDLSFEALVDVYFFLIFLR